MLGRSKRYGVTAAAAAISILSGAVMAEPMATIGDVTIHDAWARATPGQMRTSAAYMTLEVNGNRADRLIAAASPVAETAELHTHMMDGDIARMRPVAAIEIAPGVPTVLKPGGSHIMLTGLRRKLVEGETLPLRLTFERAGPIKLGVPIKGVAGGMDPADRHQPATN